ncbi:beta-glucosidase [Spartobacteria bacterium LR76]|nr:beta-glucosidase [Spartobacteria bacterium LR76]
MTPRSFRLCAGALGLALASLCPVAQAGDYHDASLPVDERVEDLLSRMTVDEKIGQLTQRLIDVGMEKDMEQFFSVIRTGSVGAYILMLEDAQYRNAMQKTAIEETRLGIPLLFGADVIHGHRTVFPLPLGLACTWDPDLVEQAQTIAAREARSMGLNWTFAPMCDLARDARWGRVAETFGEDPYLNSLYVAASVRGFQGTNPADAGRVVACLKHFAGYSASVGGRDYNHTEIPPFIFRNFHLPPFHAGVDAGALTVMSAFNANDGIPAAADHWLLTDLLRGEWGFKGFVVSDWEGVQEVVDWGYAPDDVGAALASLKAGNDMEMMSKTFTLLPPKIADGTLPISVVDEAVRRVLRVKFLSGIFEQPYTDPEAYAKTILAPESIALARSAVARSAVLLKNEPFLSTPPTGTPSPTPGTVPQNPNASTPAPTATPKPTPKQRAILPIASDIKRIALIGPFGDEKREMLGCWISQGKAKDVVTLATALKSRVGADGEVKVVQGCDINGSQPRTKTLTDGTVVLDKSVAPPMGVFDLPAAVRAAGESDLVIMALGEPWSWTGENASRARITLTGRQQELFDTIAAVGKPVVVVLFSGRPLALPSIFAKASAVIAAWQPGIQAGPGLVDILFGDVNPSGRLTISWPTDTGQVPIFYNRYNTGRPDKGFIDYRDMSREPMFPFGYGLTYTTFSYGKAEVIPGENGKPAQIHAVVTNTGDREGTEVAQLYVRQFFCPEGARPYQELRGFQRIKLRPGEKKEVVFDITDEVLGYVGRDGKWRVDAGKYSLWIAPQANSGDPVSYTRP